MLYHQLNDARGQATALQELAMAEVHGSHYASARAYLREGLILAREQESPRAIALVTEGWLRHKASSSALPGSGEQQKLCASKPPNLWNKWSA